MIKSLHLDEIPGLNSVLRLAGRIQHHEELRQKYAKKHKKDRTKNRMQKESRRKNRSK